MRRPAPSGLRAPLVLVVPAVVAAVVAVVPVLYLLVRATEGGPARVAELVWRDRTAELLVRSLVLAGSVTVTCLVIGVAVAWLTVRSDLPWRRGWLVIAALPLAVPTYVAGFAWLSFFPDLVGFRGTYVVLVACSYPYVLLPVVASLRRLDPAGEEVARSLGLSPLASFVRVVLPQLRPALATGGLLVALYALSDFGAPSLMRHDVFTRAIYNAFGASFDRQSAAVLSLVLVVVTVLLVVLEGRTRGRARYSRIGQGGARTPRPLSLGRWRWPATSLLTALAGVSLGLPATALVYWTARGASESFDPSRLLSSASSSITLAVLGAVVTTALAVPVGVLAARRGSRLSRVLEQASYTGHALPGVVIALSMVFLFIQFDLLTPLYQRTPMLVLAYVVLFLPLAVGAVHASAAQAPPGLEEVARSSGSGPLAVLRRVTLPLALPGVASGAALVLLTCMKELPATLLVAPPGTETLATRLWTETGVAAYSAAAPYAALLVALSAVPTYLIVVRGGTR